MSSPAWLERWPDMRRPSSVRPGGLAPALVTLHERYTWGQLAAFTGVSVPTLHRIATDPEARIRRATYDVLVAHIRGLNLKGVSA